MAGQTQKPHRAKQRPQQPNLILFPLCDKRGWLTSALLGKTCHAGIAHLHQSNPDSIFFAWLLDLPTTIDASSAARAILHVVAEPVAEPDHSQAEATSCSSDDDKRVFNRRLIHLLEKVVTDKSFYQAETLQTAIDQVIRESERED